jgi:hypothetical protein
MREIYNASEPSMSIEDGSEWRLRNAPAVVKTWWTLFLFTNFVGNAVGSESTRADTPEDIQLVAAASIVGETLSIAAMLAAIWLVFSVTQRQESRAAGLGLAG